MSELKLGQRSDGDVWTGYEWVSPARYEEMRTSGVFSLPPMQQTPEELRGAAIEAGEAKAPRSQPRLVLPAQRIEEATIQLLDAVDPDPEREGLIETPKRVAKAWLEWTSGYDKDPAAILKVFEDGAEDCDEMVVVKNIPVYSKCEHHLADIFGTATVAYIPNGRIVGLSKLSRLVDMYARRLQVQERMTNQIAGALMEHLKPKGCGVVIKARHMCMESRGIRQSGHYTSTSALRGVFRTEAATRAEFLNLANGG